MNGLTTVSFIHVILIYMLQLLIKIYLYLNLVHGLIALNNGKSIFLEDYLIGKLNNGVIFLCLINLYCPHPFAQDSLNWKESSNGIYITQSFCKTFYSSHFHSSSIWKAVWSRLAPPKVEVFCQQVINSKVAIKAELVKRDLLKASST